MTIDEEREHELKVLAAARGTDEMIAALKEFRLEMVNALESVDRFLSRHGGDDA